MSAQNSYRYATPKGIAGGIYDSYHYPIDSRWNEEANNVLRFGVGVVPGSIPGSNVKLPTAASTASDFEGVVINGFDRQYDLDGKLFILNNQNIGIMRKGRVWVRVETGKTPAYGGDLHLLIEGDEAGFFSTEGGVEVPGRFIGGASDGLAPIELYGVASTATAPVAGGGDNTENGNEGETENGGVVEGTT